MPRRLLLPAVLRATLTAAMRSAWPHEGCGVLGGHRRRDTIAATWFETVANAGSSREKFAIRPADFCAALARLHAAGAAFVGFVHSHPRSAPTPSRTDQKELWRHCVQVIVACDGSGTDRLAAYWAPGPDGGFARLEVAEPAPPAADSAP